MRVELTASSYRISIYPLGASFGPRQMTEYEFVWLIEGKAYEVATGEYLK